MTTESLRELLKGEFERILVGVPQPGDEQEGAVVVVHRLFALGSKELADPHSQLELKMSLRVRDLCFEFANALGGRNIVATSSPTMPRAVEMPIPLSFKGIHLQFYRFYNIHLDVMMGILTISGIAI